MEDLYRIDQDPSEDDEDNLLRGDEEVLNLDQNLPPLFDHLNVTSPITGTPVRRSARRRISRVMSPRGTVSARGTARANARNNNESTRGRGRGRGRGARFPHPIDANITVVEPDPRKSPPTATVERFLNSPSNVPQFTAQQLNTAVAEAQAKATKQLYEQMSKELCTLLAENQQRAETLRQREQQINDREKTVKTVPIPPTSGLKLSINSTLPRGTAFSFQHERAAPHSAPQSAPINVAPINASPINANINRISTFINISP